jgi:ferredoxin
MKVRVDQEACQGHAMCKAYAPDVMVLDDKGFNRTPYAQIPAELVEQAWRGVAACPERALAIDE